MAGQRLRHWKQRFEKNAQFVWRKVLLWEAVETVLGAPIPDELFNNKAKLQRFWDSQAIELQTFEPLQVVYATETAPALIKEKVVTVVVPAEEEEEEDLSQLFGEPQVPQMEVTKHGRKWKVSGLDGAFPSRKAALKAIEEWKHGYVD